MCIAIKFNMKLGFSATRKYIESSLNISPLAFAGSTECPTFEEQASLHAIKKYECFKLTWFVLNLHSVIRAIHNSALLWHFVL